MSKMLATSLTGSLEAINVSQTKVGIAGNEAEQERLLQCSEHEEKTNCVEDEAPGKEQAHGDMDTDSDRHVTNLSSGVEQTGQSLVDAQTKSIDSVNVVESSDKENHSSVEETANATSDGQTHTAAESTSPNPATKRKREALDARSDSQRVTPLSTVQEIERRRKKKAAKSGKQAPIYFVKDWEFIQTLGEGAYGEVKLAYNSITQEAVAVKIINLKGDKEGIEDDVRKEVCIHRLLTHKNIIRFYGMRREDSVQYIFLQYASGGELFDRIEPDLGMMQWEAQMYFRQLMDGLEYLHRKGITHRDIKPENLLLDENDNLKIADFGLATVFRYGEKWRLLERLCGSAPYLAPEVLAQKPYAAEPADIWSCGIVLVAMLAGELPWDSAVLECREFVRWKECEIGTKPWMKIDNLALILLRKLLESRPEKRYTIKEIRKNQWFTKEFHFLGKAQPSSPGPARKSARTPGFGSPGAVSCSQPNMSISARDPDALRLENEQELDDAPTSLFDAPMCYSQPAQSDDLLLSTQQSTQSSQTPLQRLVRRMTRFFSKQPRADIVDKLGSVFGELGYTWKHTTSHVMTVQTQDRRHTHLTFKTMILEMGESLLVDFRLSKGDGLEFKRQFVRIRDMMKPIICKVPYTWPNLPDL